VVCFVQPKLWAGSTCGCVAEAILSIEDAGTELHASDGVTTSSGKPGKPGNFREFYSYHGNVLELTKS